MTNLHHKIPEGMKNAGDLTSTGLLAGAWLELLTPFATFVTIIWMLIRIYETDTVQKLTGKKKDV